MGAYTSLFEVDHFVSGISRKIGLSFPASRKNAVASAVRRVMARRGIEHAEHLLDQIGSDQSLADEIAMEVTGAETYFFRAPAQFDVIRNTILPELCSRRSGGSPIRIWSAGCATGEEPYSLAILLEEEGLAESARIMATDISRRALMKAKVAEYSAWSLRSTDDRLRRRYFDNHDERFRLKRSLAWRVSFSRLSLGTDALPTPQGDFANLDLILCRNVLVYLETTVVRRIAGQLSACLAEGGWLLTAPSDPPLWKHAPFETSITSAGVIYRRRMATTQPIEKSSQDAGISHRLRRPAKNLSSLSRLGSSQAFETLSAVGRCQPEGHDERRAGSIARTIRALHDSGDIDAAARLTAEAVEKYPLSAELHYLQSLSFMSDGLIDAAAACLRRVVYLDRTLAAAQFLLGVCLKDGSARGALHAFENALSLCASRPPREPVPLMPAEVAGHLAARSRREIAGLERSLAGYS